MNEKQFEIISKKLDLIVKLIALNLTGEKNFKDKVNFLYSCGFRPKEIAELLGKSQEYIGSYLSLIRKEKKTQERKKSGNK